MDNGHIGQNNSTATQPFFTTGDGVPIENETTPEINDNLDYSNKSTQWTNEVERNTRNMGSSAINSHANTNIFESQQRNPEMAEVIDMAMPPTAEKKEDIAAQPPQSTTGLTASKGFLGVTDYTEKGNTISKATLKSIEHEVSEYKRGKVSPAELDDLEWEGTKAYIEHSFNREIGA